MANHSLRSQIDHAIHSNFRPGMSKHSFKSENGKDYGATIFSHSELKGLKDLSKNLSGFIKENYPEIKKVVDIKQEHLDAFMKSKTADCRQTTLKTYAVNLEKIGKCCNEKYNIPLKDWKVDKEVYTIDKSSYKDNQDARMRTLAMAPGDFKLAMTKGRDCESKQALNVCYNFGLRSREVVGIRFQDIKENSLYVKDGKGGRHREMVADTPQKRACLEQLREYAQTKGMTANGQDSNERVFKVRADSVNNYLNTTLRRAGITKYNEQKTGIHAIRKAFATSEYQRFRAEGLSHREAWGNVSEELGHGRDRNELFQVYVGSK